MTALGILGPGAVGGYLAAAIARAGGEVALVGREPTITTIERKGIEVHSKRHGDFVAQVDARRVLEDDVDVLVVATKAPHLGEALERIRVQPRAVVPLLNGVDHLAILRERFDCPVIAGTIRVQVYRESPNEIFQRVDLARVSLAAPGHLGFERTLRRAGIDVGEHESEPQLLWSKLSRLASLALSTAAAGAPLGDVRDDAYAAVREIVPVANALGADLQTHRVLQELRELPDNSSSSLREDVDSGVRDTELDAISGPVIRGAERHGLDVPTVRRLVATIESRIGR